ncbi:hypothetical protein G6K88_30930 [Agrobacterium rhizogenes]|nr:hypothetical protein [Rhizobium rhizogenes]NTI13269.1 hypothetical protein [Rhizobium rhizogenes]
MCASFSGPFDRPELTSKWIISTGQGQRYCEAQGISGKTVTVKIKYSDFTQATRSRTGAAAFESTATILEAASELLGTVYPFRKPVRLLGVTLSSLNNDQHGDTDPGEPQLDLGL